ncbi:DUF1552 domain-containing protein [Stratiformator vulcanicus]|uniref:DUF1552 domain-containing protein n=1 Tax=Stratiformator vulcanicus TaxID=2527980 RepID=A0A517QXS2_9PLAN|nr:DUF1552 domain-containing protein [Stratiformator vulcanicus]QDT36403.1 hypothetical protein Pan189_07590 [Stratiformator vulcanicus]
MKRTHRRQFLKAAGVCMALPTLESMSLGAGTSSQPKRRMVAINFGLGLHGPHLFPQAAGRSFEETPYLKVLSEFRDQYTIFSGTSHPQTGGGHLSDKAFLTAAPNPGSASFKNSISIDQLAAESIGDQTRFGSLVLGMSGNRGLSSSRNGVAIPAMTRASSVFDKMFIESKPSQKAQVLQQIQDGQSIMDFVLGQASSMQRRVSRLDRQKLDEYFTAVRAAEQRLQKAEAWEQRPKPDVDVKPPRDVADRRDIVARASLMYDMMHLALQTDSTRLITFFEEGMNAVPVIDGVVHDYHNLSHHAKDAAKIAELKVIEETQLTMVAEFLKKLKDTTEDGHSLLDVTQVLIGSNLGNASSHDSKNLPIILAGGSYRHGQHLAFDRSDNYPLPNLYVTMLQQLGLELDTFASSTGTMSGLETRNL